MIIENEMYGYMVKTSFIVNVTQVNDWVIGWVTRVFSEEYEVDINSSHSGRLNTVAFEGATKRNRPYLKVHSVVTSYI